MTRVTRRDALNTAGLTLAATAAPTGLFAQPPGPVMLALSANMADAGGAALPAEAVEHAKHHILDTLAAMVSGSELPPGRRHHAAEHQGLLDVIGVAPP